MRFLLPLFAVIFVCFANVRLLCKVEIEENPLEK